MRACVTSSPSPAPEYDSLGNRINTREKRTRGKLMEERNGIIEKYQVSLCLHLDLASDRFNDVNLCVYYRDGRNSTHSTGHRKNL